MKCHAALHRESLIARFCCINVLDTVSFVRTSGLSASGADR